MELVRCIELDADRVPARRPVERATGRLHRWVPRATSRGGAVVPPALRRLVLSPVGLLPVAVPGRRLARRLMVEATDRYVSMMRLMPAEQVSGLLTAAAAQRITNDGTEAVREALEQAEGLDALSRMQYADAKVYLPDDILTKIDRASMLNSLEVRCPFLDHHFLELMASVPPDLRLSRGRAKYLLKQAMREVLPDRVLDRPKMGFRAPLESWFRDDLSPFVKSALLGRRTRQRGIFARRALERLVRAQNTLGQLTPHLSAVLVFELWCRSYLDEA